MFKETKKEIHHMHDIIRFRKPFKYIHHCRFIQSLTEEFEHGCSSLHSARRGEDENVTLIYSTDCWKFV